MSKMKPAPFRYAAPGSLQEALELLHQNGRSARVLAGGQSLIPALNFRSVQVDLLVDINRLDELDFIQVTPNGGLRLGGLTRQRRLEFDPLVERHVPLMHQAVPFIAHPAIRNRGTLGGSLAYADPAAEQPAVNLACGANFRVESVRGSYWIPAVDFFRGFGRTALQPDEILVEIEIPPLAPRTGWGFAETARRQGDRVMMGVATLAELDEDGICRWARLVYLNAGDTPMLARQAAELLVGQPLTPEVMRAAAITASQEEIDPLGDIDTPPGYQRFLAHELTLQALSQAAARVLGEVPVQSMGKKE
jgi:aerobic carbon-monoxide dehydrogenase medium subunit